MMLPILYIDKSVEKGKGVFACETIAENTVIEISPVIVLSKEDRLAIEKTKLFNYIFEWGDDTTLAALGMGYVSMYNHSYDANCVYEMDYEFETITIKTVRKIKKNEELTINYNAIHNDETPVWFDAK